MDKIFETVGLDGPYQKILLIINLFTGVLPCIYSFQIPFLTKHPSFFVQKLKSDDPNKIYEMEFNDDLCNSSLYKINKNPENSIINWSYSFDLFCEKETYITIITSIVFIGGMIGTLTITPLLDKYGRSLILKICVSISLIHCYYTYLVFKYFLESPRWLHSVGNKERCLETLTKLAINNGREEQWIGFQNKNKDLINKLGTPFLEKNENNLDNKVKLEKNYNIIEILKFKSQRTIFIKLTIISTFCSYNYYGIILNLGRMKGNFYLNSIFAFLGELISELVSGELADYCGRISIFLCSCALGIFGYTFYLISPYFKFFFVFIAMLGFAGIFNVMTIYSPEIYPTKIRNITYSYTNFICRLSPICVPIFSQNFSNIIDYSFILSAVINFVIGMTLEETKGKKLLDIIPEEEEDNENLKDEFLIIFII